MLYYFPKLGSKVTQADFAAAGLAHAWPEGESDCRTTNRGPDGGEGVVVAHGNVGAARVIFSPDSQTWRQVPGSTAWCGYYTAQPPAPEQLARAEQIRGQAVRLADDQLWEVPIVRAWDDESGELVWYDALPKLSVLDDEGHWHPGEVVRRYRDLADVAIAWWDAISGAEVDTVRNVARITFDYGGLRDGAARILAANYRIGQVEAGLLSLFDDRCVREVLYASIDWPTYLEYQKKTLAAAAGSSSEPGEPADSLTTDQP